jgi:ADP-ribose pyrophosphatase
LAKEKTLSSRYVYKGKILNLRVDSVLCPDGQKSSREIVEHAGCVVVVPMDDKGDILMVRQFRKALEKELLEIPAGGIEAGEDPEAAVKRELQEEIGYLPGKVERLGGYFSSPGFCTEYLYLFLATELKPSRLVAEDTEEITTVPISRSRIKQMIAKGEICDAKSIAGLLYFLEIYTNRQK